MQKKSFKIRKIISIVLMCAVVPTVVVAGYFLPGSHQYYIIAAAVIIMSMVPFFLNFEHGKHKTREVVTVASLTAIAVASRAVFYMLPEIKPIGAVVVIAAVCFGSETGFMTGAMSMLLSNIIFGQGAWTPFQMFGLGMAGYICGLIFVNSDKKYNRLILAVSGGLIVFVFYGLSVDTNSVLMMASDFNIKTILSIYVSGMSFNAVFGGTTALLLFVFGKPLIERLDRIKKKYGIFGG